MRTLKKLKLTQLSTTSLEERTMNQIRGGNNCGCACVALNSDARNTSWNWNGNMYSPEGNIHCSWEGSGSVNVYGGSKAPGMP